MCMQCMYSSEKRKCSGHASRPGMHYCSRRCYVILAGIKGHPCSVRRRMHELLAPPGLQHGSGHRRCAR
ncbi:hypothetical protein K431DRAFT_40785 [Polychaeton citri CBS 116435]|uniref:Uncharacterized protein n=1 Tax=Polychaeton citri CBS 116435 TaxID=1314669 RepID=A0A9P4QAZ3_9PEZI|nr:hypothetical protein K431DRAFT_40785 [Polychaeton citri CBS 116435]